jgi:hypothetical protein
MEQIIMDNIQSRFKVAVTEVLDHIKPTSYSTTLIFIFGALLIVPFPGRLEGIFLHIFSI